MEGKVKWFDKGKGFGFIYDEKLGDIFVHYASIEKEGYKTLREGQKVEFELGETDKGYQALHIHILKDLQTTK